MGLSSVTALALGLLATTSIADSSLHYKLRARVNGPKNDATPKVDGWPMEVQRLGVATRLPPDYMWGVLNNQTFRPSRGGDVFYTQPGTDGKSHIRTDAPNNQDEVTPFGFAVDVGSDNYPLANNQMNALRYNAIDAEMDIGVDDEGVPFLRKPGFENATWVACDGLYQEWDLVSWIDLDKYGTDPIYHAADYLNCTEIQIVPECASEGPDYEGLQETPCVADFATLL